MLRKSQYGQPFFVGGLRDTDTAVLLPRVHLGRNPDDNESQEFRLQSFIMRHPKVLPIGQIDKDLIPAIPVCMELPTKSNFYVDNFFVTPGGDLILVECKLWHNYESRRDVVLQILEYGKELSTWHYDELEAAIAKGTYAHLPSGKNPHKTLYDFMREVPDVLDEPDFIDEVSRCLRRGRFLLLIVGDGIHEGVERLTEYVQLHAGLHFTLGLVDIAIFQAPVGGFYVQPRTIVQTVNIDRGIVSIKDGTILVEQSNQESEKRNQSGRRTTITGEKYFEALGEFDPTLPEKLRSFMGDVASLGIETDFGQASLVLRWRAGGDAKWNLGYVDKSGKVYTDMIDYQASQFGRPDLSNRYHERLCSIIPGAIIKKTKTTQSVVTQTGTINIRELLSTNERRQAWMDAIEEFIAAVKTAGNVQ